MSSKKRRRSANAASLPKKVDGQYTFYGVYRDYKRELVSKKHWIDSTVHDYDRNFEKCIGPYLSEKPITEYTSQEIFSAMDRVQADTGYKDSTMNTLFSNIRTVYKLAVVKGLCPDVLWGTEILLPNETPAEAAEKELIALQKSLSTSEEIRVFQQVFTDHTQDGENFGVALMFALGLRNAEACAINFGDIRPMDGHPNCSCLWIFKTVGRSNQIKPSGKTKNADRIIPLSTKMMGFFEARRKYLEGLEAEGALKLNTRSRCRTVLDLPIACVGKDYISRCSVKQLSTRGKEVLRDAKVDARTLGYIDAGIKTELLKEKEPTAYLFRRNFATQLYILGLNESEIQYIMGHGIEDTRERRNYFNNESKLYPIKLRMDHRALLGSPTDVSKTIELNSNQPQVSVDCWNSELLLAVKPDDAEHMLFHMFVSANEPNQRIRITFDTPDVESEVTGVLIKTSSGHAEGPANILSVYLETYQKKQELLAKKRRRLSIETPSGRMRCRSQDALS